MSSTLTRIRGTSEDKVCETVTHPVILLAPRHGGNASAVYKVEGPVEDFRLQIPLQGRDDIIMHVEVNIDGRVTVYTRAKTWAHRPEFDKLGEINVVEELEMKRLAQ